jgi:hemoglobin-like flavoprotein
MSDNELFDLSYGRVFGEGVGISRDADPFFESFYNHFLLDAEVAAVFSSTNMTRQVGMLRKSFFHLVAFYVSNEPSAELERIAVIHHKLGIDSRFYDNWSDALIKAVGEFDPDCDLATELAWRWAMAPGLTYMRLLDRFADPDQIELT